MISHFTKHFNFIPPSLHHIIILTSGYTVAIMSTMLMYTLLPVLITEQRGVSVAGIALTSLTLLQIFLFGPLAASFVGKYSIRTMLFVYTICFGIGAIVWLIYSSLMGYHALWSPLLMILMCLCFSAGYGARMIDGYILRTASTSDGGIAFGLLVTFAGLGRLLGTLIQPHILQEGAIWGAVVMLIAMIIFFFVLSKVPDDRTHDNYKDKTRHLTSHESIRDFYGHIRSTLHHGRRFVKRCHYMPLLPLSLAFWEGIFFGSLWFVVPIMLMNSGGYQSSGREIGIYEAVSTVTAVCFGIIADRWNATYMYIGGWFFLIIGLMRMCYQPMLSTFIRAGIIIGIANNILYASAQHLLEEYDSDHNDDASYDQLRQIVVNIGFIVMPLLRGLLNESDNDSLIALHSGISFSIALCACLVSSLIIYTKRKRKKDSDAITKASIVI